MRRRKLYHKGKKIRRYGWRRSLPDYRDYLYAAIQPLGIAFPPLVDLRSQCPGVYDQGNLGSCTANAIGGLAQFLQIKEGQNSFIPSRLFIYFQERVLEGTVRFDAGAENRSGMKVISKFGVSPETLWPYLIRKFKVRPPKRIYNDAKEHKVTVYLRVNNTNLDEMKSCLVEGFPVVAGFRVYESFESVEVATTGNVPLPTNNESAIGGHAVLVVGYDDTTERFIVRNSWGESWGDSGYCYMPYDYLTNGSLADDFWTAKYIN